MKVYKSFSVAGLSYYEAPFVIEQMRAGDRVKLKVEKNNIHDEYAVAIYYKGRKLGYIPRNANYSISVMLQAGWKIFKAYVQRVDKSALEIDVAVFVRER